MDIFIFESVIVAGFIGLMFGYIARQYIARSKIGSLEQEIEERILSAKKESHKIEEEALVRVRNEEETIAQKRKELRAEETEAKEKISKLEERLDKREADIDMRDRDVRTEILNLKTKSDELNLLKENLDEKSRVLDKELERIALLSREEARERLFASVQQESSDDLQSRILKLARDGEVKLEEKARDILVSSIYRIGNGNISQFMTATVEVEDDETKGKVIGKEGRNIKTFERMSGVELLIDEVPNAIVVSCFDPVRRAIAKNALEMLIKDGRIQPAKIEECLEKAKKEIGVFMRKKGEAAVLECGLLSIPEELIPIIGRLYFRTSYGQNVLDHSIEMAHIAGLLATELGADIHIAKAGSLLHDIGKAVDHEIQGTHVEIGRKILMKYGVDERIIKAMQAHHEEYPYETIESVLVQVADAISGGRPGARRDTVDRYIKRLEDLEALAMSFSGIERVYALQAGREIRIFVSPTLVSDVEARELARNIAIRVEQELRFPGEIKINVIRESRVIEFAR
jgi:ribonuclease Y